MKTKEVEIEDMKFKLKRLSGREDREIKQKTGFMAEIGGQSAKVDLALYQHMSVAKSIVEPKEYNNIDKLEDLDKAIIDKLWEYVNELNNLSESIKKA